MKSRMDTRLILFLFSTAKRDKKLSLMFLVKSLNGADFSCIVLPKLKRPLSDNGWISDDSKYLDRNKKLKNTIENEIETYLREILRLKNTVYLKK